MIHAPFEAHLTYDNLTGGKFTYQKRLHNHTVVLNIFVCGIEKSIKKSNMKEIMGLNNLRGFLEAVRNNLSEIISRIWGHRRYKGTFKILFLAYVINSAQKNS